MASKLSPYDFSTLYTTLSHHLIKDKLVVLIEHMFTREKILYLPYNEERAFLLLMYINIINYDPVKTFVKPLFIFWVIFSLDLKQKVTEKL